jgi:hypothetical protein
MRTYLCIFLVLLMLAFSFEAASAQCTTYNGGYYQPQVVYQDRYIYRDRVIELPVATPIPFVITVPTVSYLWNGSPAYQAVPMAQYQQPQPQQAPQAQPQAQTGLFTDAQLDQLIEALERRYQARQAQQQSTVRQPQGELPPVVPGGDDAIRAIFYRKRGAEGKSCMDCHGPATAKGGLILIKNNQFASGINWNTILEKVDTGAMPPEARKNRNAALSNQEVALIREKMLATMRSARR